MGQCAVRLFSQAISIGIEAAAAWGTAVPTTLTVPVTNFTGSANIPEVFDEGRRGIGAADFAAMQGAGMGELSIEQLVYPDAISYFLWGILGADAITGMTDPYTHTMTMSNACPSFTVEEIVVGTGSNGARQFTGARITSVGLSFNTGEGAVTASVQMTSKIPTKVTAVNPAVVTGGEAFMGWSCTFTSTNLTGRVTQADINFTRDVTIEHGGTGSKDPTFIVPGPLRVAGTVTLTITDLTDFDRYLTELQQAAALGFTLGTSPARTLTITMTQCNFNAEPLDLGADGQVRTARLSFRGIYNSTDTGPAKVVLVNGITTALAEA